MLLNEYAKRLTFHCKLKLFFVLLISLGAAGGSGSQLSVVKLTNSETDSFMELLVTETLNDKEQMTKCSWTEPLCNTNVL